MCYYPYVNVCCCSDRFISCIIHSGLQQNGSICLLHPGSQKAIANMGATGLCAQKKWPIYTWVYFQKSCILAYEIKFSVGVLGVSHDIHWVEPWNNSFLRSYSKFMTSFFEDSFFMTIFLWTSCWLRGEMESHILMMSALTYFCV